MHKSKCKTCPNMNFFGFQFIIGNSSVTATKKFQNILSSSVIAGGIYGEHLSQNRRIDRNSGRKLSQEVAASSDELPSFFPFFYKNHKNSTYFELLRNTLTNKCTTKNIEHEEGHLFKLTRMSVTVMHQFLCLLYSEYTRRCYGQSSYFGTNALHKCLPQ